MAPKIVGRFETSFCGPFKSNLAEKDEEGSAGANWLMPVITILFGVGGEGRIKTDYQPAQREKEEPEKKRLLRDLHNEVLRFHFTTS